MLFTDSPYYQSTNHIQIYINTITSQNYDNMSSYWPLDLEEHRGRSDKRSNYDLNRKIYSD